LVSSRFAIKKLASSTNKIRLDLSDTVLERSLTYIKNNNGPGTEPCGIPFCTCSHLKKKEI